MSKTFSKLLALKRNSETLNTIVWADENGASRRTRNSTMSNVDTLSAKAARIADRIVRLVEKSSSPVSLHQIEQRVPGFAAVGGENAFAYDFTWPDGSVVTWWNDMTAAGKALMEIFENKRVTLQHTNALTYFLYEYRMPIDPNWLPVLLLPVEKANWRTSKWLVKMSPELLKYAVDHPEESDRPGQGFVTPGNVRSTLRKLAA